MRTLILGMTIITIITLLCNVILDYFILKTNNSFISYIKSKKTMLMYGSIILIEIIIFLLMGLDKMFYMYYFVILILYRIMIIDYKTTYIDNKLLIVFAIIAFLSLSVDNGVTLIGRILTAIIIWILLVIISKITQGALGLGDAKVIGLLGLIVGFEGLISILLISSIVVFLISIILLIKSIKNKNKELPFTPYIFVSLILMLILNNL